MSNVFSSIASASTIGTQGSASLVQAYHFESNSIVFQVASVSGGASHKVVFSPFIGDTFDLGVKCSCDCAKDKYFGYKYIRNNITPLIYNYGNIGNADSFPAIKNPSLSGVGCHHIISCALYLIANPDILVNFEIFKRVKLFSADKSPLIEHEESRQRVCPIYNINECTITAVSLVSTPAISSNWRFLPNNEIVGYVLTPDRLIYRKDDLFIKFSEDSIVDASFDWYFGSDNHQFTLQHSPELTADFSESLSKVVIDKCWIETEDYSEASEYGLPIIPYGWCISIRVPSSFYHYLYSNCTGFSAELLCQCEDTNLKVIL